jgi:hypothetical protein
VKIAPPPSQESRSIGSEYSHSGKNKVEEASKSSKVLKHKLEASLLGHIIPQEKAQLKPFLKQGQTVPPSSPTTPVGTSNTTEKQQYTDIGTPITSLTPLQFILVNPNFEIVFIDDLTPISPEEMPP